MVLINKHPKLSCHMPLMPINDIRRIKPVMLICFCSAKFLLKGANIVPFSKDYNIVSSLICRCKNKSPMGFLDPFLQMSKGEFRYRFRFILGQVWDLIVSIPDLCTLTYF